MPLAVLALGGNALLPRGQTASIDIQFRTCREAMKNVVRLIGKGWDVVLTHGNGPQVGNILLRSEAAVDKTYPITLGVAVAESEGEIGYIVQQSLYNELRQARLPHAVVTILTQVVVDPLDPAFKTPTKPIGPYYPDQQAKSLLASGLPLTRIDGAGWRRLVASPRPLEIVEASTVRRLVSSDVVVVAAGGGGIPVVKIGDELKGIDAVIDKDLASCALAKALKAECFVMLTDVPRVALHFRTPQQRELTRMTLSEARKYMAEGHFPPGSMGPKLEAAIDYAQSLGRPSIITSPDLLERAMEGKDGTTISPE